MTPTLLPALLLALYGCGPTQPDDTADSGAGDTDTDTDSDTESDTDTDTDTDRPGLYVSASHGTTGAAGSMADPFLTVQEAVDTAAGLGGLPVYVAKGTYSESVSASSPILGGYDDDVAGWPRTLDRTHTVISRVRFMSGTAGLVETATLGVGLYCAAGVHCEARDAVLTGDKPIEMPVDFSACGGGFILLDNVVVNAVGSFRTAEVYCGALTLRDSVVDGTGAFFINHDVLTVERSTIALTEGGTWARGMVLSDSTFTTTAVGTDALFSDGPVVIDDVDATGVRAGLWLGSGAIGTVQNSRLTGSTYGLNVSAGPGGVTLTDNLLTQTGDPGTAAYALYVSNTDDVTALRNTLVGGGGDPARGAYLQGGDNTIFAHNTVRMQGSSGVVHGLYVQTGLYDLTTVGHNSIWVEGGDMEAYGWYVSDFGTATSQGVNNLVVVDGTAGGTAFHFHGNGFAQLHGNTFVNGTDAACTARHWQTGCVPDTSIGDCSLWPDVCTSGADNNATAPTFADVASGDFGLVGASPGLDDGVDPTALGWVDAATWAADIDGTTRPAGGGWDRGALER